MVWGGSILLGLYFSVCVCTCKGHTICRFGGRLALVIVCLHVVAGVFSCGFVCGVGFKWLPVVALGVHLYVVRQSFSGKFELYGNRGGGGSETGVGSLARNTPSNCAAKKMCYTAWY